MGADTRARGGTRVRITNGAKSGSLHNPGAMRGPTRQAGRCRLHGTPVALSRLGTR